mmetsp:Transcript_46187/g.61140  ORF Transcript_46187/g.61140 Transcript_46187/m.61140 type:complete len:230 (-) Transcript_46187:1809-2498(-)
MLIHLFVHSQVLDEVRQEGLHVGQLRGTVNFAPDFLVDPVGRNLAVVLAQCDASSQQELELGSIKLLVKLQELDREHKREDQFILLKQRDTGLTEKKVKELCVEEAQALFENVTLFGLADRTFEELDEEGQRILIHRINVGQVLDREEETSSLEGDGLVTSARIVDLLLGDSCLLLLLFDLSGELTSLHQSLDGSLVTEDVLDFREYLEHFVLSRGELFTHVGLLTNQV